MKKLAIVLLVALTLTAMFAVPVLADQPEEPGLFGKAVSSEAQKGEKGFSGMVHIGQQDADSRGITYGNLIKLAHEFVGIPPGHTP